jgi:hypothetical protein
LEDLWTQGFKKEKTLLKSFAAFRLPSGTKSGPVSPSIRLKTVILTLGTTRINFRLNLSISLSTFVSDPYFTHVKYVSGESVTYSCKVLDMNTIPQAKIGSTVQVLVKYTHSELTLKQIDSWMSLYGELKSKSR